LIFLQLYVPGKNPNISTATDIFEPYVLSKVFAHQSHPTARKGSFQIVGTNLFKIWIRSSETFLYKADDIISDLSGRQMGFKSVIDRQTQTRLSNLVKQHQIG
tara:strand:- start:768 stop:1076 length:309 start_codon:yes stop_codon:yes gene_type:complete